MLGSRLVRAARLWLCLLGLVVGVPAHGQIHVSISDPQPTGAGGGDAGPPPRILFVGPATPGWIVDQSGLSRLELRFDAPIDAPIGSVRVAGIASGPVQIASQLFDPVTNTLTVDLAGAVQADIVTVVVDYSITAGGVPLDGESGDPEAASFPSGDGHPGGQSVFRYRVLRGDVTQDGVVDQADTNALLGQLGLGSGDPGFDPDADLNADGWVNVLDVAILFGGMGGALPPTDGVRPAVQSIDPPPGGVLGGDLAEVVVAFTEPVDPASLDPNAVYLVERGGGLFSATSVTPAGDGMSAAYAFSPAVPRCGDYTLAVSPAIGDPSGELLIPPGPFLLSGISPAQAPVLNPVPEATRDATVTISGLAPNAATVEISSEVGVMTAAVANGAFSRVFPLAPDRLNTISVTAITPCGTRSAPRTVEIIRDNERPDVFIDFPADGAQIQADTTDVAGRVSDRLSGFQGLTVTVNGQPAQVNIGIGTNGTFFLPALPLNTSGPTEIEVVARDGLQNGRVVSITVEREEIPAGSPRMEIAGGNGQSGIVHSPLSQPLAVRMLRADGTPFSGKVVTFQVSRSDGRLGGSIAGALTDGTRMYQVLTDSQGMARAYWVLGSDAGMGNNRVDVTSRDIAGTILFCASATPAPPDRILIGDGNNQRAEAGAPLPEPLRVWVNDACNGVGDIPVTFTVTRGDGVFANGLQQITADTGPTGHLDMPFTLGQTDGLNIVQATFPSNPGLPATFLATGIARDLDAPTTFVGTVLDNAARPLGNARMELRVGGQIVAEAFTDVDGRFGFSGVPDGPAHVVADGSTADTLAGEPIPFNSFPFVGYDFTMVPNAENRLPQPVLLPQQDPANQFLYDGSQDVEMTVAGIEGLKFTVAAGTTVRLADGTVIDGTNANSVLLTLDQVHFDDIPMPLPDGASYPFAWTLQPKAATFDPPVAVELPNMAALAPGSIGYILQWDGELDEFVITASGQVSDDGSIIRSDPGSGITVAGWGGACPPYPATESITNDCSSLVELERQDSFIELAAACVADFPGLRALRDLLLERDLPISDDPRVRAEFQRLLGLGYPQIAIDNATSQGYYIQDLASGVCQWNLDEYRLQISDLPPSATPETFFRQFIASPNSVIGNENLTLFTFRGDPSSPQVGDLYRLAFPGQINAGLVIVELSPTSMTVATIGIDQTGTSPHPVSGFREFSLVPRPNGGHELITRGLDRPSNGLLPLDATINASVGYTIQQQMWSTGFGNAAERIASMGGSIEPNPDGTVVAARSFALSQPTRPDGDEDPEGTRGVMSAGGGSMSAGQRTLFFRIDWALPLNDGTYELGAFASSIEASGLSQIEAPVPEGARYTIFVYDPLDDLFGVSSSDLSDPIYLGALNPGPDADQDGVFDVVEYVLGTDTLASDSDSDLADDLEEVIFGTNPRYPYLSDDYIVEYGQSSVQVGRLGLFAVDGVSVTPEPRRPVFRRAGNSGPPGSPPVLIGAYAFGVPNGVRLVDPAEIRPAMGAIDVFSLMANVDPVSVLQPGQNATIEVIGTMSDGGQQSLQSLKDGTVYSSTNPGIASVDQSGLVTASTRGTVFITATNNAVTATRRIDVVDSVVQTTITGLALLEDGSPATGAEITLLTFGGSDTVGSDGTFAIEATVPAETTNLALTATLTVGDQQLLGSVSGLTPVGGLTDAGVLTLRPLCDLQWASDTFCLPGLDGTVIAAVSWDDGTGEALYVGGSFTVAGCATAANIARWDGSAWSPLGSGVSGTVNALTVFDDGSGPALYAGGQFTTAGGQAASNIARWDGTSWSPMGSGMNDLVFALTVFDDGSGPALYAGGSFTTAGGQTANRIARWDGSAWSPLGAGMNSTVVALTVFDDGSGPALYAGGVFTTAGGQAASYIARWDGAAWSPLGSGMNNMVWALRVFDDGSGPVLYAGGQFTTAGGQTVNRIARWDGTSWSPMGSGMNDLVFALTVFDDGSGPALYAGGNFTTAGGQTVNRIARWDGTSWSPLGSGMNNLVFALTIFDDGSGPALYAGGEFTTAGGQTANRIAKWDGSSWSPLGSGVNNYVNALTVFNDGSGPALYAGGGFTAAGGQTVNRIARWDGSALSPLGSGMNNWVNALTVFDDGSGPALYAGGDFSTAGGQTANRIARWDGSSWSPLGSGMNNWVNALTVFDDGSGPALYAGGGFTTAGGQPASRIAKWDGSSWSPLGSGMNGTVNALTVFDDGSGPALYAGGGFTAAGGQPASRIAKWDGTAWSPLGSGMNNWVNALMVFDDGSGPAVYAGGFFTTGGGQAASYIAMWDGTSWSPLGSGMNSLVWTLTIFDDGSGPALYAGGEFTTAGGQTANRIAKWDGSAWSPLGSGVNSSVVELAVFDDGSGPALYAGGYFTTAGGSASAYIAKWSRDCTGRSPSLLAGNDPGQGAVLRRTPALVPENRAGPSRHITIAQVDPVSTDARAPRVPARNARGDSITRVRPGSGEVAAVRTRDGSVVPLGTLGGETSVALAINDAGQVVGWSETEGGSIHAFRYTPGLGMQDLGTLGGAFSVGMILNEAGDTAGFSDSTEGLERPFRYTDADGLRDLGAYIANPGRTDAAPAHTRALAISPDGRMVAGSARTPDGRERAILWTDQTGVIDLNTLLPAASPWRLDSAEAFDADGVLVGRGVLDGEDRTFRLELEPPAGRADLDGNGIVDAVEVAVFAASFAAGEMNADLNRDGVLDLLDLQLALESMQAHKAGTPADGGNR